MECIQFEWDENKNHINQNKHKISFEEAKTVFYDDEALVIDDPDHSEAEERFIILGLSNKANLLIVCHCYRASDTVIRIISARRATKTESRVANEKIFTEFLTEFMEAPLLITTEINIKQREVKRHVRIRCPT